MITIAGGKIDILVEPDLRGFPGKLQAGLQGSTGIASSIGRNIGLALAGGLLAAGAGFSQVIKLGNDYQGKLNEIQAVSGATADTMARVASRAKELGSDLSLSGVSAGDAAAAMLELAKGGLSVDEAMTAAKGTLQLAGAAQIEGARAAEIQSQALNQFGLAASEAGRVADILANTANAASGGVDDIALAMKYVGPVARAMSISIEDTATAIGLLANNGIMADNAGTALRGMLVSLASPSKEAKKGLDALGITAFDSQGNFVGLRSVIGQLSEAQGRMTDEQFASAAAMAFGREPLAAITALAAEGAGSFDEMSTAVNKQGGAAEVAAAKMKGLGGAMEGFKSNLETVAIGVYELIDGPLESLVRAGTEGLDALNSGLESVGKPGALAGMNTILQTGRALWDDFVGVLRNVRDAADPVIDGVGKIIDAVARGDGATGALSTGLRLLGDAALFASGLLVPIGEIVGGLLSLFSELPGPIQTAALALLALKAAPAVLSTLRGGLGGVRGEAEGAARSTGLIGTAARGLATPFTAAAGGLRQFNSEMRLQRQLAAASGESIGRLAAASAAFETTTIRSLVGLRSFRDQMRAIQAGAAASQQPISGLTAAFRTLAERSPGIAAMGQSFSTVSSAVQRFGRDAGAAASLATEAFGTRLADAARGSVAAIRGIPAAVSSAASTLSTGLGVAAINTAEAIRRIPSAVTSAAATLRTGLGVAAINAGDSFRNLGTSIQSGLQSGLDAVRRFPDTVRTGLSSAADAVRQFPTMIGNAFRAIPGAVETGISAIGRFTGVVAGVGASIGTGLIRAGGSLVSFLGGPWGVALAAASVALSIFAGRQAEAEAKTRDHQAALDSLRGTLDKYSGAVTQSTINEKANQLAKDGTLEKVKSLGISTQDYVRATLGEADALQRVQGQLTTHTRGLIENTQAYRDSAGQLRNLGISLDDLTAAAQGNQPAIDKVNSAIRTISDLDAQTGMRMLVDGMLDAGSASADLARELGITNGDLARIQQQTRDAAEASGDFAAKLDFLKQGLGGLKDGATQTDVLKQGLAGLSQAAGEAATRAGESAKAIGGVGAGAEAAAQSMQKSRDSFIEAAQAAGLTEQQANALADQIGLIPAAARTNFETNATGVAADLQTLAAQVAAVPGAKQITVQALSEEATAKIEALGFKVTTLPNGQVQIDVHDEAGRAKLEGFLAFANTQTGTILLDANPAMADGKIQTSVALANGSTGTITIDGNQAPVDGKIRGSVQLADGSTGTITIDGNPNPATGQIHAVVQLGNGTPTTITINPRDLVSGVIRTLQQPTSSTHTIRVQVIGAPGNQRTVGGGGSQYERMLAQGGIVSAMHDGGVVGFAAGGMARKLRPMRGGIAQMVPPNTWRVVGDRLRDDEAYIPINRSRRSQRIFEETARRMGYSVARMYHDGGLAEAGAFRTQLRSVIASRMSAALGRGSSPEIAAAIAQLQSALAEARRTVEINVGPVYNPVAETSTATAVREARTLSAMGAW